MSIRIARIEDAEQLSAFLRRTFVEAYGHVADAENIARFLEDTYAEAVLHRELADPAITTWIDEDPAGWRGVVQLQRGASSPVPLPVLRASVVRRLYVDRPFQGSGVAAALLSSLEQGARAAGDPPARPAGPAVL